MAIDKRQMAKTRYVCLGERVLEAKKILGISPSAKKALSSYLPEAMRILGSKDGLPDWEKSWDPIRNQALWILDAKEEYDPLMVESLLFSERWNSGMGEGRNSFLFRGEDGEIYATDEGVKVCTQRIKEGFEIKKKDLQNPPESIDNTFYTLYVFFTLVLMGDPIYHPRARSVLNEEQREVVDATLGAIVNFFTPYFKKPPDEVLDGFSYYYGKYMLESLEMKGSKEIKTLLDVSEKQRFATSPVPRYATPPILNPHLWEEKEKMLLYFAPITKERVDITYVIAQKDRQGVAQPASGEEAWAIVQTFGVETALLHITFAASCMATEKPWSNYAKAEGDKLIKLLRLNEKKKRTPEGKRVRLTRDEQLQELRKYLHSLKAIYVQVKDEYGNIIEASEVPAPLWDMDIRLLWKAGVFSDNCNPVGLNVYIRAGRWAMGEMGHRGHMLYSHLYKKILDFNLLTEDWAFKWAIYTSCFMGAKGSHAFKIRTLLEAVMDPEEIKKLEDPATSRQERYGAVTKLENQLQYMEKHGWKIEKSQEYQMAMGTRGSRRQSNFFPKLLESTVTIIPPEEKALPEGEKPKLEASCKPEIEEPITGTIFRDQRTQLGLSQKEAGNIIGKSQKFISLVEHGERRLSPSDQKKWEEAIRKIERTTHDK